MLIVIALYILLAVYTKSEKKTIKRMCTILAYFLIFLLSDRIIETAVLFLERIGISSRSLRQMVAGRFFSLVQGTGGRSLIYEQSIEAIKRSPAFGYGIKGDMAVLGAYPHNFILECAMQFGIPLTIIIISILVINISITIKKDIKIRNYLLMLCTYAFTFLFVSGSFWALKEFWIIVSLLIVSSKKIKEDYMHD